MMIPYVNVRCSYRSLQNCIALPAHDWNSAKLKSAKIFTVYKFSKRTGARSVRYGTNASIFRLCQHAALVLAQEKCCKNKTASTGAAFRAIIAHEVRLCLRLVLECRHWFSQMASSSCSNLLCVVRLLIPSVGAEKTGDGDANMGRYSNPKLDALIDRIKVESDFKKRDVMLRNVLIIRRDDLPIIPLFQTVTAWVMRKNVNGPFATNNVPYLFRFRMHEETADQNKPQGQ